jgi:hypothetical protein
MSPRNTPIPQELKPGVPVAEFILKTGLFGVCINAIVGRFFADTNPHFALLAAEAFSIAYMIVETKKNIHKIGIKFSPEECTMINALRGDESICVLCGENDIVTAYRKFSKDKSNHRPADRAASFLLELLGANDICYDKYMTIMTTYFGVNYRDLFAPTYHLTTEIVCITPLEPPSHSSGL